MQEWVRPITIDAVGAAAEQTLWRGRLRAPFPASWFPANSYPNQTEGGYIVAFRGSRSASESFSVLRVACSFGRFDDWRSASGQAALGRLRAGSGQIDRHLVRLSSPPSGRPAVIAES